MQFFCFYLSKLIEKTWKTQKNVISIIWSKTMGSQIWQFFQKSFFHANGHNFLKNKWFLALLTENWISHICPQNNINRSIDFVHRKNRGFIEKSHFFQKNAQKSKIQNTLQIEKNFFCKNVLLRSSYIHEKNHWWKNERNRRRSRAPWSILIKIRS